MARSIWTGYVSFGLVTIPVRLVSAVREKDVRFHQFHERDGGRIRYHRFCEQEDKEVPYEEIAKGYEVASGEFVLLSDEELERLEPEKTLRIDIDQFTDLSEIDPIYFDTTYYLVPGDGGERPYGLLRQAMEDTRKAGLGRFVMREKEHVVAIRPLGPALALDTLFYSDEVVTAGELEDVPDSAAADRRQLKMAQQLIQSLAEPFDPDRYHDEFREKVQDLAEKKARGKKVVLAEARAEPARVVDLMDALRASVEAAKKNQRARARKKRSA